MFLQLRANNRNNQKQKKCRLVGINFIFDGQHEKRALKNTTTQTDGQTHKQIDLQSPAAKLTPE